MSVQIQLKAKYRSAHRSRYSGGENAAPKKKRTKMGYQKHCDRQGIPPLVTLYVDGRTGKGLYVKTPGVKP